MINAAYMAFVVMAWAVAVALAGSVALYLVSMALDIYKDYFHRW